MGVSWLFSEVEGARRQAGMHTPSGLHIGMHVGLFFYFLLTTCSKENQDHKKKDLRSPELNEISEMPTEKRIRKEI